MTLAAGDLGLLGQLGQALGIFGADGQPNPDWFAHPEDSLKNILAAEPQRRALLAFIDEALGGTDRTEIGGITWLPLVEVKEEPHFTLSLTVDERPADGLHIGVGLTVRTSAPASSTSLAVPLFRAAKTPGQSIAQPLLLGSAGGRLRMATAIIVDTTPAQPGQARLGGIGIDVDLPTAAGDPGKPQFGLSLTGFQLPGAQSPRDMRVAADGAEQLDDALLELVLALVKSQADAAASSSVIAAAGGLLGLRSGDEVPDFPITELPTRGLLALADWVRGIFTRSESRVDWLGHLANLLGGTPQGERVQFAIGDATLTLGLAVASGPSGHAQLTPQLGLELGDAAARVEVRADLMRVDLVTGQASAMPSLGLWAAAGRPGVGQRVLDLTTPRIVRADALRIGFTLDTTPDTSPRLTFVLAADGVQIGDHPYATLDLTSPDAVMDAAANTVSEIAEDVLSALGADVLPLARQLLGLAPPAGVTATTLPAMLADPLAAVAAYWQRLVADADATRTVLAALRGALADASQADAPVGGDGSAGDPWRVPLIGPLELQLAKTGTVLDIGLAAGTEVDVLGRGTLAFGTRVAATLARVDLAAKSATLLPGVEARLSAGRPTPPAGTPQPVRLQLGTEAALLAGHLGLRLAWAPRAPAVTPGASGARTGLTVEVSAPLLRLELDGDTFPIALPVIAADGQVTLPAEAWDALQALAGHLGELTGGLLRQVTGALGWSTLVRQTGEDTFEGAQLRLADLIVQPEAALRAWLPRLVMSDLGPQALHLIGDLFVGAGGGEHGFFDGSGHPDDPYRLPLAAGLPNIAVWFPPQGLEPRLVNAPEALRQWRPGDPGLSTVALQVALQAEAEVAADVRDLIEGRDVEAGLDALAARWLDGDGRITPLATPLTGIDIERIGLAAPQLFDALDLADLIGRTPSITVYVALGAEAWPAAPTARRVDLSTPGLEATMFTLPAAAAGDWFVALGRRADCRPASGTGDGTPEQAARLAPLLAALAAVPVAGNDIALVALHGAGHAARIAAEAQPAVADLVLLGTPLSAISLAALSVQPMADALRLMHRLLPPLPDAATDEEPEDEDLTLGRALVGSMMELVALPDPSADLRPPAIAPPTTPRAGLTINAVFGAVPEDRIAQALTAIVAAGLAARARVRAATPLPEPVGINAGLRWQLPTDSTGTVVITGSAELSLFGWRVEGSAIDLARVLRVRLRLGDRLGWLAATPELELRAVSVDLVLPLDGQGAGESRLTLHDARVFGQGALGAPGAQGALTSAAGWERLVVGNVEGAVPLLPEARVLLAAAVQRLTADLSGTLSLALSNLLAALGLTGANGALVTSTVGMVGDAVDQLVHDPAGLVRQRLAAAPAAVASALQSLLGAAGASVDLAARRVRVAGGNAGSGRFGWSADVIADLAAAVGAPALSGQVRLGPDAALPLVGGVQVQLQLQPLQVSLRWHRSGGGSDNIVLWPAPDASALAGLIARAAPGLAAQAAVELMRRADAQARPLVDALLDMLGLLNGAASDAKRALRPLVGLVSDPTGWLLGAGSLGANAGRVQSLFDALRPLMGLTGAAGDALTLAPGVRLEVVAEGTRARLALQIEPTAWTAPTGVGARLTGGIGATLSIGAGGPPAVGLAMNLGLPGAADAGRRAVHARLGAGGIEIFLRPEAGNDIPLIPFAGLGSLSTLAEAALPFLLDRLAEMTNSAGQLVTTLGDTLALRIGTAPRHFDADALRNWARDPVTQLAAAVPSLVSTGLTTIAPLLDDFVPGTLSVGESGGTLSVSAFGVTLAWAPATGTVSLAAAEITGVPGIERVGFAIAIEPAGLREFSAHIGPADIDAGGVHLAPYLALAVGRAPVGGRRIQLGMAVGDTRRFAARWELDPLSFALIASDGALAAAVEVTDAAAVALRAVEILADLVAAVAMAQPPVQQLLGTTVGSTSNVRKLLAGVVLRDESTPSALITGLFDPATLLPRAHQLFINIAAAGIRIPLGDLTIALLEDNGTVGLQLGIADGKRVQLVKSSVLLWLETDDAWITDNPPGSGGVFVGFMPTASPLAFTPSLKVNGVGLRLGKSSGPLLDSGISIDSVALHLFAALKSVPSGLGFDGAGLQLQFSNLAVAATGARGNNGIAQGVMRDTGPTPPKPQFSPALAIQKHDAGAVAVTLRAGDGAGPWWIAIQKGFGPLYLEQIGFGATMPQGRLERVSLLMDGSISMFGLTCAVDDLQITYMVANGDPFNPHSWAVDLAGLAVSANMGGVSLAGGLLKQTTGQSIEYLGMLLGRFGVYGLTVYGGFGEGVDGQQKFTAFFAIGAVNGPIGGPPAFFLTGIGGGFGINRKMVLPTDLSQFGNYPLIQALDIAAKPGEPMAQLRALGAQFPMQRGTFWFAAGLSFNSFALVDGIAVVGVQIGDGLDINLLGLARMALPRPQVAIVSIELALLARFSSSEGVLWVQGQLTDNSWLLVPEVKLTGGFAFVTWFKGQHAGEFVLTMGGYHPEFHRDGYPVVPRLGLRFSFGDNIVIKAGSYFALTSEALMAGGDFEASATWGPAWAELKYGAHGIVFFDPFSYDVKAYARIAAGVTIDTWLFGEITINVHTGARIHVQGPEFRGRATFDVGPVGLTFAFGGEERAQRQPLAADAFIAKYLAAAASGRAQAHAVITDAGTLPSKGDKATPDGSSARPFIVVAEFSLTFTSMVPATAVTRTLAPAGVTAATTHAASGVLGVAPMEASPLAPRITFTWLRGGVAQAYPFIDRVRPFGRFPIGVWGPAQDPDNRKLPKGEMIEALNELTFECRATVSPPGPEIPYFQVEIGKRRPLPFTRAAADVGRVRSEAGEVTVLVAQPADADAAFVQARRFLSRTGSPTAMAALRGERQAPPRMGTLTEGLESATQRDLPVVAAPAPPKVYDHVVDAPVVIGLMGGNVLATSIERKVRTTVAGSAKAWRRSPPTLAAVEAERSRSVAARLVLAEVPAQQSGAARTRSLIAAKDVPPTAVAHGATAIVARAGAPLAEPLRAFAEALAPGDVVLRRGRAAPAGVGAPVATGQAVVMKLPNALNDAAPSDSALRGGSLGDVASREGGAARPRLAVSGGVARLVLLGHGGRLFFDGLVGDGAGTRDAAVDVPQGCDRLVAIGQNTLSGSSRAAASAVGLAGWHAGSMLPYAGWASAIGPGCVVRSSGIGLASHRERAGAGWVNGAELAQGESTVSTTFAEPPRCVLIVLDDPAAAGDPVAARQLLLGLDGASRALDAGGTERAPALLALDNRSVLAYDVVPTLASPASPDSSGARVVVTVASQTGWSLAGVMGSAALDALGAIALVAARGLDAALRPQAPGLGGADAAATCRLLWLGPRRTREQQALAKSQASDRPAERAAARAAMGASATSGKAPRKPGGRR